MVRKTTKSVIWCFPKTENPRKMNSITSVKFFLCILLDQCLKAIKEVIKEDISISNWTLQEGTRIAKVRDGCNPFMTSQLRLGVLAHEENYQCLHGAHPCVRYHHGANRSPCVDKTSEWTLTSHASYWCKGKQTAGGSPALRPCR